ncbi:MAG TPA: hypothetical protein VGD84_25525 [Pseudonocardiaceae bacterium]
MRERQSVRRRLSATVPATWREWAKTLSLLLLLPLLFVVMGLLIRSCDTETYQPTGLMITTGR